MNSGWWVAERLGENPAILISWVVWVIGSICLHELAHGWAAIRCGDDTPIATGHMTWNPLVHMGPMSLIMFALVGIAWGAMPISPSRMRGRHAEAFVAAAGPAMNLALAAGAVVLGALWLKYGSFAGDPLYTNLQIFFFYGVFLNLVLAAFNLMPVPPLDGSRILGHYSQGYRQLIQSPQAQTVALILFIVVFLNFGDTVFGPASVAARESIGFVAGILP